MRTEIDFAPMWAVPPGRTICDLMKSRGIASTKLANLVSMTEAEFDNLLSGKSALTAYVATHLETNLGASANFWLRREEQYRKQLTELNEGVDPEKEEYKSWLKSLPLKEMQSLGLIESTRDQKEKLRGCLSFFDVPNLDAWYRTYVDVRAATAFRTTDAYLENVPATSTWLRLGELQAAKIECQNWSPERFKAQLTKIRSLTKIAAPSEFLPKLQNYCAEVGVAVVVIKAPTGCRASGATFFANPNKAVLLLSFRYLSDDQFWFSFFHEAAHLILHWDADLLILETSDGPKSPREEEANAFASEQLIPHGFQTRMREAAKTLKGIMRLAQDAGVSYGIVVGQMQFRGFVRRDRFNRLKTRYKWDQLTAKS
ncbi:XRE family transcriptional regulator [Undibacterium sp. YM2]|uniref:ImmA/IrrE family metallo-endopeptidase n=1 Tax=Undibacterium sp. YM2 TaxID=2058625 RepID=UPI001331E587|nr:ImmA/IrrE family metallo-endopeptidase [Undibacterium sp. YM2]BBB64430.1 XRE family transcriptional regulator [Undibacterium sp. YM2]